MRIGAVGAAEDLVVALGDRGPFSDEHAAVSAFFVGHLLAPPPAKGCSTDATTAASQSRRPQVARQ